MMTPEGNNNETSGPKKPEIIRETPKKLSAYPQRLCMQCYNELNESKDLYSVRTTTYYFSSACNYCGIRLENASPNVFQFAIRIFE